MAKPQKITINVGDKIGSITVLDEWGREKHGHLQYKVKCDCGKIYICNRAALLRDYPRCAECLKKLTPPRPPKLTVGSVINNWGIISVRYDAKSFQNLYSCRCTLCGYISERNHSQIQKRKGKPCSKCIPDYHFRVFGTAAYGTLPSGEEFIIDVDDMKRVNEYYWHIGKEGYAISTQRNNEDTLRLHNFIMNFSPSPKLYVDHINRKKLDCRKSNLRIVTAQQNAMNKSRQKNNTTGFVGVTFEKSQGYYKARIGLNNRRIHIGTSKNPVICAQMYNWAAIIIFGEFTGELNVVPEPSDKIKHLVEEKCKPYLLEAEVAAQPCSFLYLQRKGA